MNSLNTALFCGNTGEGNVKGIQPRNFRCTYLLCGNTGKTGVERVPAREPPLRPNFCGNTGVKLWRRLSCVWEEDGGLKLRVEETRLATPSEL
jgi:hypothetical protein